MQTKTKNMHTIQINLPEPERWISGVGTKIDSILYISYNKNYFLRTAAKLTVLHLLERNCLYFTESIF